MNGDIDIVIDELDLSGVPRARHHQVIAVFERELHRLIAERGLPDAADTDAERDTRSVALGVDPTTNPLIVGAALAASVYEGLR